MPSFHFYTVTIDGVDYATDAPFRKWADVEAHFGLPREMFRRGARAGAPTLTKEVLQAAVAAFPKLGKAYRSKADGVVRWVVSKSERGNYRFRWLSEKANQWHLGGMARPKEMLAWVAGEEVPAPQPGDKYVLVGPTGVAQEYTA